VSRSDQARTGPDRRTTAAFAVECPGCRAHLAADPKLAGGAAACPVCQAEFLVPAAAPAATADAPVACAEPPLPTTRRRPDDAFVVAQDEAGAAATEPSTLAFHEPVRTVAAGGTEIELRRLSPDERRARRAQRNLIILVVGAALLVALVVMLATGGR
jgi:hypothetical protein